VLTALAQATRPLRLGTLVTGIHYRHPAVLANMAATIDIISGGRLELGIGAGWNEEESGAYGIELGARRERAHWHAAPGTAGRRASASSSARSGASAGNTGTTRRRKLRTPTAASHQLKITKHRG